MNFIKKIYKSLKSLEIKLRSTLSHWPILYAFIGSIGVVLIWRGVWMVADDLYMPGWVSILLGVFISMSTGLFVSFFVGDRIIISGIKHEKRIDEKTEEEIRKEEVTLSEIQEDLQEIKQEIGEIDKEIDNIDKEIK